MRIRTLVGAAAISLASACGGGGGDSTGAAAKTPNQGAPKKDEPKLDEDPAKAVHALVKAISKGDDALAHKRLAEKATWRMSSGDVVAEGPEAITAYLRARNSALRLRLKGNDVYVHDTTVVLVGSWIGVHVREFGGVAPTKEGVGLEGAIVFETKGGRITEVIEYMDLGQLYAQVGAVPPEKVWAKRGHVSAVVVPKPKTHEEAGNDALAKHLEDLHASFLGGEAPAAPESASPELGYWETPYTRALDVEHALARFDAIRTAFPDLKITTDDKWAVGNVLFARSHWIGTQRGDFEGWPASNKSVHIEVLEEVKVEDGKTTFWTLHFNGQAVLEQMGVADPLPE